MGFLKQRLLFVRVVKGVKVTAGVFQEALALFEAHGPAAIDVSEGRVAGGDGGGRRVDLADEGGYADADCEASSAGEDTFG